MHLMIAAILCGPATIDSEAKTAQSDVQISAPTDRAYLRYLTLYSIPTEGGRRREARKVIRGWVNFLSTRRRFGSPIDASETLIRVDLRDYGWSADAWEKLLAVDPYVNYLTADKETLDALAYYTGSASALVRLDWFASKTCVEPNYSRFLGLSAALADLQKQFGVQKNEVKELSLIQRGAIPAGLSEVAIQNRLVDRYPTITGYYYQTFDVKTNVGDQNVLDNPFGVRFDGGEVIWSLPNGLQGYWLLNADGKQVAEVPPDIARDSHTPYRNKSVINARSCIGCHSDGLKAVADAVSKRIRERKVRLGAYSKEQQIALEELFLSRLRQSIELDQRRYADALHAACGLKPGEFSRAMTGLVHEYDEGIVDARVAALELGASIEEITRILNAAALKYPQVSGVLTGPIDGTPIGRDSWEQVFGFAAAVARQKESHP